MDVICQCMEVRSSTEGSEESNLSQLSACSFKKDSHLGTGSFKKDSHLGTGSFKRDSSRRSSISDVSPQVVLELRFKSVVAKCFLEELQRFWCESALLCSVSVGGKILLKAFQHVLCVHDKVFILCFNMDSRRQRTGRFLRFLDLIFCNA